MHLPNLLPTAAEVLSRSVERRTLRYFHGDNDLQVNEKILSVLLKFVTSMRMIKFSLTAAENSPVSFETIFVRVIDTFTSRDRVYRFIFDATSVTDQLAERFIDLELWGNVGITYSSIDTRRISIHRVGS
uniref:ANF_receptor domain-containing protein n=1 Tax=Steinernema glaseri TaxID=37863 RepID=A0A1I7ZW97_9BILA